MPESDGEVADGDQTVHQGEAQGARSPYLKKNTTINDGDPLVLHQRGTGRRERVTRTQRPSLRVSMKGQAMQKELPASSRARTTRPRWCNQTPTVARFLKRELRPRRPSKIIHVAMSRTGHLHGHAGVLPSQEPAQHGPGPADRPRRALPVWAEVNGCLPGATSSGVGKRRWITSPSNGGVILASTYQARHGPSQRNHDRRRPGFPRTGVDRHHAVVHVRLDDGPRRRRSTRGILQRDDDHPVTDEGLGRLDA